MSDIFLSYASDDRPQAKALAESLETRGWSVWWDRTIPAGRTFDEVIEKAIDEAKCIIVLWSKAAVKSRWVRTEAEEGARRNILVPVLIEQVKIPLAFRRIQAADLISWDGDTSETRFDKLIADISSILGPSSLQTTKGQHRQAKVKRSTDEEERERAEAEAIRRAEEEARLLSEQEATRKATEQERNQAREREAKKEARQEPLRSQKKPTTHPVVARESPPHRTGRLIIRLAATVFLVLIAGGMWYAWEQRQGALREQQAAEMSAKWQEQKQKDALAELSNQSAKEVIESIAASRQADANARLKAEGEKTRQGFLGIRIQTVTSDVAKELNLSQAGGALVVDVAAGSPAEKAGIKNGDVIIEVRGKTIEKVEDVVEMVAATPPGKDMRVKILSSGILKTVTAKLWEGSEDRK